MKPNDSFDIADVEHSVMYVFCAEPTAVQYCEVDTEDFFVPEVRAVIQAARLVHARGDSPTVEYLAAAGGGELDTLRMHGRRVTRQMREDWSQSLKLIQLAAQRRKLLALFLEAQDKLVKTPLLDLATFNEDLAVRLAEHMVDKVTEHPVELNALLDQVVNTPEKQVYDPIPTGACAVDTLMRGGIRLQQTVVIAAPFKGGKTTLLRQMLYHASVHEGTGILHVAADGGNASRHALIYLGMHAAWHCLQNQIPTLVQGFKDDALYWENLAIWLSNQNPKNTPRELFTPIVPQVEEMLHLARNELRALKKDNRLLIVDPQTIGYSPQRAAAFIRKSHHHQGTAIVGVDHIGKFGDRHKNPSVYERIGANVQTFSEIPGSLPVALILLSQMNASGIRDVTHESGDHQDWSAGTEGGMQSQQEGDLILQTKRKDDTFSVRTKLARDGASQGEWQEEKVHNGTGLFLSGINRYQTLEGY